MALRYEDTEARETFLDEEEGRITFHHDALDPKASYDTHSEDSFGSDEFQQEEKAAITTEMRYRRNKMYALIAVCLVILATIIVVPIVLVKSKKTDQKTPDEVPPEPSNATDVPVLPENVTAPSSDTPAPVEPPAQGGGEPPAESEDVPPEQNNNNNNSNQQQQNDDGAADDDQALPDREDPLEDMFTRPEPVPSSLQGFSTDVLEPYTSREALEKDLTAAAEDMVEGILRNNVAMMEEIEAMGGDTYMKNADKDKKKTSRSTDREEDVKEGDSVQEDGTYVYAAYGDRIVVWNRQDGKMVTEEAMPSPQSDPWGWTNQPWIQTIQLTENHVFVFAGGYGKYDYGYGSEPPISYGNNETKLQIYTKPTPDEPFLTLVATQSLNGVHIQSRYMTETGTFHIVTGVDVNTGGFLGDPLGFYHFFPMGLYMNSTEYRQRAAKLAYERLIPSFVEKLMDELMENSNGQLPTVMQLNSWQVPEEEARRKLFMYWGGYNSDEAIRSYVQVLTIKPDDLPVDTFADESLKMKSTVMMGPTPWSRVHASGDDIILTMERYNWNPDTQVSDDRLFLLQLKVHADEGSTSFHAATSFAGNLACNYPMDIEGDDLRVAVTHQVYYPYDAVYQMCGMPRGVMMAFYPHGEEEEDCGSEVGWMECHDLVMDGCMNVTKSGCPHVYECADDSDEDESSTENSIVVLGLSGQDGVMPERGRVLIGNPHDNVQSVSFGETFSYALTTNFGENGPLYVMNLQEPSLTFTLDPSQMEGGIPATYLEPINEAGTMLVGIGMNVTERGMFYSESGVMVSVIDVSDPEAPAVLASQLLDGAEGFSSPHSIAQYDAKAVQYTDDGLLIIPMSMYPKFSRGYDSVYSEYYNPNNTEPMVHSNAEEDMPAGFEGFVVLDVSNPEEDGIKEVLRINHMGDSGRCNYCNMRGFIPHHRSFWYEDDNSLMTMYSHKVFSTNLGTMTENWGLNISEAGADNNCCF